MEAQAPESQSIACGVCGKEYSEAEMVMIRDRNRGALTLCPDCFQKVEQSIVEETRGPRLWLAIPAALLAGAVLGYLWYLLSQRFPAMYGIFALGAGWLVGEAARFASGKKRGLAIQITAVFGTLLAVVFNMGLMLYESCSTLIGPGLATHLAMEIYQQELVTALQNQPILILYWFIGLLVAFTIPARRQLLKIKAVR